MPARPAPLGMKYQTCAGVFQGRLASLPGLALCTVLPLRYSILTLSLCLACRPPRGFVVLSDLLTRRMQERVRTGPRLRGPARVKRAPPVFNSVYEPGPRWAL